MKKKVDLNLVTGDENLVTKDEYYLMYEGDEIVALAKRDDSGELVPVLVKTEEGKLELPEQTLPS